MLQLRAPAPFMTSMIGATSTSTSTQYDIAMEKKVQDSVKEEGQQALKLIDSAAATPQLASSGDVGTTLHTVA